MILYEFFCNNCQKEFEELVINSNDKVKCPFCGSKDVKRILSPVRAKGGSSTSSIAQASTCMPSGGFS